MFSQGHLLSQEEFQEWSDLLAEAIQGNLNYQRLMGIPALAIRKERLPVLGLYLLLITVRCGPLAKAAASLFPEIESGHWLVVAMLADSGKIRCPISYCRSAAD